MKNNLLQTVQVDSTAIQTAEYEYATRDLTLQYRNGASYTYKMVPNFVFEGLRSSESKGKFLNRNILQTFRFVRA
jgi:hypothetical protein